MIQSEREQIGLMKAFGYSGLEIRGTLRQVHPGNRGRRGATRLPVRRARRACHGGTLSGVLQVSLSDFSGRP
jgi:hypothetical protein